MHPANPDSATERRPSATSGQYSSGQYSSDTDDDSIDQLNDNRGITKNTEDSGRGRRNSITDITDMLSPENMRASAASMMSALTQDDKAILQRKGASCELLWQHSFTARVCLYSVLLVVTFMLGMNLHMYSMSACIHLCRHVSCACARVLYVYVHLHRFSVKLT